MILLFYSIFLVSLLKFCQFCWCFQKNNFQLHYFVYFFMFCSILKFLFFLLAFVRLLFLGLWLYNIVIYLPEKAMATHSSTLAWKIPCAEEPVRLQSMGSVKVRHDWVTSHSLCTFRHWRRKWKPTPVYLPGESQRRGSLVGCRLWGRTESDITEVT